MKKLLLFLLLFQSFSSFNFAQVSSASPPKVQCDFDGDGKSDISVFRPSDGHWYILNSSGGYSFIKWGLATDKPVPGDYDGDGRTDLAVYRSGDYTTGAYDGVYYILRSSANTFLIKQWGKATGFTYDLPLPADYDGDGKTDIASYHDTDSVGSPSYFTILQSSDDSRIVRYWGTTADTKVPADYDGDGKADLAVFRKYHIPSGSPDHVGNWYIWQSSNNAMRVERFGLQTDKLVPSDYDGDSKADLAVWRASNRTWYRINSSDRSIVTTQFGLSEDKPVPADYDGDGKTDIAVFRPSTGIWYLQQSRDGFRAEQFGLSDDIPIPNVFVR